MKVKVPNSSNLSGSGYVCIEFYPDERKKAIAVSPISHKSGIVYQSNFPFDSDTEYKVIGFEINDGNEWNEWAEQQDIERFKRTQYAQYMKITINSRTGSINVTGE
jgi:hypothetical protein